MAANEQKLVNRQKHEAIHGHPFEDASTSGKQAFDVQSQNFPGKSSNYESLTGKPQEHILPTTRTGNLSLEEMTAPSRKRVLLVRYSGEIREVYPEEYEEFKDNLAEGIYFPVIVNWPSTNKRNKTTTMLQRDAVKLAMRSVPSQLSNVVRDYFGLSAVSDTKQRVLSKDPKKVDSVLRVKNASNLANRVTNKGTNSSR